MTTIASHFGFKLPHLRNQHTDTHLRFSTGGIKRTRCPIISYCLINSRSLNPKCTSARLFLARVSNDSEGAADASSQQTTPSVSSSCFLVLPFLFAFWFQGRTTFQKSIRFSSDIFFLLFLYFIYIYTYISVL